MTQGRYTAGELVVDTLAELGTRDLFTLCGNHVLPIAEALRVRDIRVIATRSEASAVFAADAYGRVARRPGVAVVTGGPGMSNTVTAMLTAQGNRAPVVVISGERDQSGEGHGAQQEAHHLGFSIPASKWQRAVRRVDHLEAALVEAYRVAQSGTPGPVHLSVPLDVLRSASDQPEGNTAAATVAAAVASPSFIKNAAELLSRAQRPAIIAGAGVWQSGGEASLLAHADRHQIPIFTIDSARGALSDEHPIAFGSADRGLNAAAGKLVHADVVVVVGRPIDFRLGLGSMFAADATVIHVDTDAESLGRNVRNVVASLGDPGAFLADLSRALVPFVADEGWLHELRSARRVQTEETNASAGTTEAPHPAAVAEVLGRVGNEYEAIFSMDCGEFAQWGRQVMPSVRPGHWLRLGPQATCGAGLPFGMGAKVARPDSPSLVVAGDGGLGYHITDIETCVREGVPLVVVVGQDNGWGIERNLQTGIYGPGTDFTTTLSPSDFVSVAAGFGADAVRAAGVDDLEGALRAGLDSGRPTLISIPITNPSSKVTDAMVAKERSFMSTAGAE